MIGHSLKKAGKQGRWLRIPMSDVRGPKSEKSTEESIEFLPATLNLERRGSRRADICLSV
jgi:hypothetical protein